MTQKLSIFNVTNRPDPLLEELHCIPAGVGKNNFPNKFHLKIIIISDELKSKKKIDSI